MLLFHGHQTAQQSLGYDAVQRCQKCPNHPIIARLFEGVLINTKLKYPHTCNDISFHPHKFDSHLNKIGGPIA